MRWALASLAFAIYVGLIFAANWAVDEFGIVSVGLGLYAPAAVYFVGVSLIARDFVQGLGGKPLSVLGIMLGAGLSAIVAPRIALASACAFLASESIDLVTYSAIAKRHWLTAVAVSGAIALVVDSLIFLWLAFHSFEFLPGQLWGKAVATAIGVLLIGVIRAFLPRNTYAQLAS